MSPRKNYSNQADRLIMRMIFASVAERHGMSEADMYVRDRRRAVAVVRWEAWVECRNAGCTYSAIAGHAGWHPSTVVIGVDRWLNMQPLQICKTDLATFAEMQIAS